MHRERDPVTITAAALATAKNGIWLKLDARTLARQFRAFVLLSLQTAPLSHTPVPLGELGPHLYSTQERNAAGSAIARTLVLLAPPKIRPTADVITEEDAPTQMAFETGAAPVLIVLLVSACALAAAYLGSVIAEAVYGVRFDDEITKRMLSTQAKAVEVLALHVERERIAGHELPFDDNERAVLLELERIQRELATAQRRPLPTPFDGATEFVRAATSSLLPMALIALVAFLILSPSNRRS
ncbi:hypothetical protein [Polyangium sp. 6x1]|uniref:hypothetical protein n=1 Tax=Polyangium sp. 6x1 TaxID=3042689 RepID=UPI002482D15D|nr:hypothetical protein [Polyangium sp. 6x1]MDI1445940.1 hypothetical protein [Polyangium sp. 6x1]